MDLFNLGWKYFTQSHWMQEREILLFHLIFWIYVFAQSSDYARAQESVVVLSIYCTV